jgi:hypothetical protein
LQREFKETTKAQSSQREMPKAARAVRPGALGVLVVIFFYIGIGGFLPT